MARKNNISKFFKKLRIRRKSKKEQLRQSSNAENGKTELKDVGQENNHVDNRNIEYTVTDNGGPSITIKGNEHLANTLAGIYNRKNKEEINTEERTTREINTEDRTTINTEERTAREITTGERTTEEVNNEIKEQNRFKKKKTEEKKTKKRRTDAAKRKKENDKKVFHGSIRELQMHQVQERLEDNKTLDEVKKELEDNKTLDEVKKELEDKKTLDKVKKELEEDNKTLDKVKKELEEDNKKPDKVQGVRKPTKVFKSTLLKRVGNVGIPRRLEKKEKTVSPLSNVIKLTLG